MNGYIFTLVFVPLMAFVVIVLPTWITFYYRDKRNSSRSLSEDEWKEVDAAVANTERLSNRIATLEAILDAEHRGWRAHQRDAGQTDTDGEPT